MNKLISINPADESVINEYDQNAEHEVNDIILKVSNEQSEWKKKAIKDRIKVLLNVKNDLSINRKKYARLITSEMGKPISESIAEINKCIGLCEYYFSNAEDFLKPEELDFDASKSFVRFEPLGVILGIMPWNFPFWQVFRFAIPALLAGNTVLLKHASNVQGISILIDQIFNKAHKNLFNSLIIDSKLISKIISNKDIKAVSFTGSDIAGSKVAKECGKNIKKSVLELGGADSFIVLDDVDMKQCINNAVISRMINNGQSCIAAKRFIVHEDIHDQFVEELNYKVGKLIIGNPDSDKTDVGPLATENILIELDSQIQKSINLGATLISGGFKLNGKGYFYSPTIITDVTQNMPVYYEETFGPVFTIIKSKNINDMIEIANDSDFGLGGSSWSNSKSKAFDIANKIETGCVFINGFTRSDPKLPFGGIKKSGYGKELSKYGIREFVNIKTIVSYANL